MAGQRKIESEQEARRCLIRVEAEGGRVGKWSRAHGIDGRSLNAWRVNLARREAGARVPRQRRPPASSSARMRGVVELVPTPSTASRYVLEIGGVRIEFGDDFSEPALRRLVGVLRSC